MITLRDVMKSVENILIVMCAVFVCTVFLNYRLDLLASGGAALDPVTAAIYDGKVGMSTMMILLCAGVLGSLAALMLVFSVGRFVEKNKASMGVLKALGYGRAAIALRFAKFGLCIFVGAAAGCALGYAFSPLMYSIMNEDLFEFALTFHYEIILFLVVLPTALFSLIAVAAALVKLRKPPLAMISGEKAGKYGAVNAAWQRKVSSAEFPKVLRRSMLLSSLLLIFFVGFASFAFSAQLQIAFVVRDLGSDIFFSVLMTVLAFVMAGACFCSPSASCSIPTTNTLRL